MAEAQDRGAPENEVQGPVPPRLQEPFGDTAVEAVPAARPVVVPTTGGPAEAFDGFASALPVGAAPPAAIELLVP
jgi:hypothetical protein